MARVIAYGKHSQGNQVSAVYEGHGMKVPQVTGKLPETGRSNLQQDEADLIVRGGPKRCCVHAFV